MRVRVADGPETKDRVHLPGEEAWLVAERRPDEVKYDLTNHPATASLKSLASAIKARWSCEQAHQQLKEELGLDHFEGRTWRGLHHHALMTLICFAFLQQERLRENKSAAWRGRTPSVDAPGDPPAAATPSRYALPAMRPDGEDARTAIKVTE